MNSELLWRGYPTDQRGTPFRQFWGRLDGGSDILPIHQWSRTAPLATAGAPPPPSAAGEQIVLLIRGTLLRRYPDLVIYATPGTLTEPGTSVPPAGRPLFSARLEPDFTLVGFPLTPAQLAAEQWWFVLEQQLTAPRFGFDLTSKADPAAGNPTWSDVTWTHVGVPAGRHISLHVEAPVWKVRADRPFGSTADRIAISIMQRPIRVALHKDRLLLPAGGGK